LQYGYSRRLPYRRVWGVGFQVARKRKTEVETCHLNTGTLVIVIYDLKFFIGQYFNTSAQQTRAADRALSEQALRWLQECSCLNLFILLNNINFSRCFS
jgi:hypothetical protein